MDAVSAAVAWFLGSLACLALGPNEGRLAGIFQDVTSLRTEQQQQQDMREGCESYLVAIEICSFRVAFDLQSNHGQVETLFVFG
ncbi:hypothetical protein HL42_5027 [Trichophyton rubrum]|nr:hypothetical protein HL42_5027 [Trichophyton rubrum]